MDLMRRFRAGFAKADEDPGPLGLAGLGIQLDIIKDPMNIVNH